MQHRASYEQAIVRKYPEQVVVAIARESGARYNPITLGWTMITSGEPPMMAVAIGAGRFSAEAFRHAREFVIAFPSASMEEDTLYFGTVSGRDIDKLTARETPTQPASEINCVLLSDAVANFECVLEAEMCTGDHWLFVGRVVAAHVNTDVSLRRLMNFGDGQFGFARAPTVQLQRAPLP